MIDYVTPALIARLFPDPPDDAIVVTEPLPIDPTGQAVGIDFAGTRFLVFFADVMAYAGNAPPISCGTRPSPGTTVLFRRPVRAS